MRCICKFNLGAGQTYQNRLPRHNVPSLPHRSRQRDGGRGFRCLPLPSARQRDGGRGEGMGGALHPKI